MKREKVVRGNPTNLYMANSGWAVGPDIISRDGPIKRPDSVNNLLKCLLLLMILFGDKHFKEA